MPKMSEIKAKPAEAPSSNVAETSEPQRSVEELWAIHHAEVASGKTTELTEEDHAHLRGYVLTQSSKLRKHFEKEDEQSARDKRKIKNLEARLEKQEKINSRQETEIALREHDVAGHGIPPFRKRSDDDYVYIGRRSCCLDNPCGCESCDKDENINCHHEVCSRASTEGLTFKEISMIKYYQLRLADEKSDRRRHALVKQRDVEFARIKKEEADELARKARKAAHTSKAERDIIAEVSESMVQDAASTTETANSLQTDENSAAAGSGFWFLASDFVRLASMDKGLAKRALQAYEETLQVFSVYESPVLARVTKHMKNLQVLADDTVGAGGKTTRVSRFTEDFDENAANNASEPLQDRFEGPPTTPVDIDWSSMEELGRGRRKEQRKERRKEQCKKRVQELIDGDGDMEYCCSVAEKLRREAEDDQYENPLEPFERFEKFFTSIGPMPDNLVRALDDAKAKIQDGGSKEDTLAKEQEGEEGATTEAGGLANDLKGFKEAFRRLEQASKEFEQGFKELKKSFGDLEHAFKTSSDQASGKLNG